MNSHTMAELAEYRRQELIAEATLFRQQKRDRASRRALQPRVRNRLDRPLTAFRICPPDVASSDH